MYFGINEKLKFRAIMSGYCSHVYFSFIYCHFSFILLLLPEGRAGKVWEASNKVMLYLPPPSIRP